MKNRDDALAHLGRRRLDALVGNALSRTLDPELQLIVEEAARLTRSPISLVSLLLDRTQLFRAHHGLPKELAVAQATDGAVSFCQYVVRDSHPLEVNDAQTDERVPQELVSRYGIRAYLGTPVWLGGQTVGSLCVIDTAPRVFSEQEHAHLQHLAVRASDRLTLLSLERRGAARQRLLSFASAPIFNELKNVLGPLNSNTAYARTAAVELQALTSLLASAGPSTPGFLTALDGLRDAARAADELLTVLNDVAEGIGRVQENIFAIEAVVMAPSGEASAAQVTRAASQLAQHLTKLVGGVHWVHDDVEVTLRTPPTIAVSAIAVMLRELAEELSRAGATGGIAGAIRNGTRSVISLRAEELTAEQVARAFGRVSGALSAETSVLPSVAGSEIFLSFERVP